MATLRQGSRGSAVKALQDQLRAAGFDPGPSDGIYGPKTAAAVSAYQKSKGLTVDGIAGTDTMNALNGGDPATEAEKEKGADDQTDDPSTRFIGLPGNATELWKIGDEIYAVFFVPDTEPPVPMLMQVENEEVAKTYFKDDKVVYDRVTNEAGATKAGAVFWGDVADLKDRDGDPWAGFLQKMERAREVMPWLEDPQVWNIIAAAYLEGRPVEDWELATTDYFRGKTEAERQWMTKVAQDPATAVATASDNLAKVYDFIAAQGIGNIDPSLAQYIADQWTTGRWSEKYAIDQIGKLAGGGENVELDPGLNEFIRTEDIVIETAANYRNAVLNLYSDWLGPMYTPTEAELNEWAGLLRDDETGGTSRLTEHLRGQRLALFPEYSDPTLRWVDIAGPWKSMAANTWGVPVDETDPRFQEIVRMNNATEAQREIRKIGVEEGYERVASEALRGLESGMSRNVRGAV
jgi:hypothetical protein